MLYHVEEWQSASGNWYCEHTKSFPEGIQKWVVPARILGIPVDEFLKLLFVKFPPDEVFHNKDCSFVGWSWKTKEQAIKYKNFINEKSKNINFQI